MTPTAVARQRAARGLSVDTGDLSPRARRALRLADELGAPRGPALAAVAAVEEAETALRRQVEVASAGPRAVARGLVLAPPMVGPTTALLVSDDPFAVWATPLGRGVATVAVVLWLAGWTVVRALVRRAAAGPDVAGPARDEVLELVAIAVAAGSAVPAAVRRAGHLLDAPGGDRFALWLELGARTPPPAGWEGAGPTVAAAVHDGVPLVPLLRGLAAAVRSDTQHEALRRAARLEARLALPTTLLLLPAAGLVVAAPLVHGIVAILG